MPNLAELLKCAGRRREGHAQGPGIPTNLPRGGVKFGAILRRLAGVGCLLVAGVARTGSIVGSKHDLSSNRTPDSMQVCIFCHTPHNANNTLGSINAPLWNRFVDTTKNYLVYSSPSMVTTPGKPSTTISAVCLGCHDGTMGSATVYAVAGNDKMALISAPGLHDTNVEENCTACHDSLYGPVSKPDLKFGLDLTNMHPIAVPYPTGTLGAEFHQPPDPVKGWPDVRLFNGRVECPTCHHPHDPTIVPFLAKSNAGSALCLTCHIR
jgi:predicted CXXCH cytochrome family protein